MANHGESRLFNAYPKIRNNGYVIVLLSKVFGVIGLLYCTQMSVRTNTGISLFCTLFPVTTDARLVDAELLPG
jgi:hypothetical protein